MLLFAIEVNKFLDIRGFSTSSWTIDDVFETVGVSEEVSVHDLVVLVSIYCRDVVRISVSKSEAKGSQHLTEDLGRHFEMSVAVKVLEEALGVESVLSHELCEVFGDTFHVFKLILSGRGSAVDNIDASSANFGIQILFKTLLCEGFVNGIAEISPLNVIARLWSLVLLAKILKFRVGDGNLSHVESNSELRGCDVARSQSVEVSEEFTNSDSLLSAGASNASENVIHIVWGVTHNFSFAGTSLSLWEELSGLVVVSANSEKHLLVVNILSEVDVVDLIDITLVHVSSEEHLHFIGWCCDFEQVKHSQELSFGHMTILSDVEVLEDWLQVNALV